MKNYYSRTLSANQRMKRKFIRERLMRGTPPERGGTDDGWLIIYGSLGD